MRSVEELQKVRAKAIKEIEDRENQFDVLIEVAMSTCGITAGAKEVMEEINRILKEKDIPRVSVSQTGCPGLCFYEPLVTIIKKDEKSRYYGKIKKENVEKLIEEEVINNRPIKEWLINLEE